MNSSCFQLKESLNFRRIRLKNSFVGNVFLNKKEGTTEMKLNEDAYRILDLLDEGKTVNLCSLALAEEYGEEVQNVESHVKALVEKMVEKGFGALVPEERMAGPQNLVVDEISLDSNHHLDGIAITLLSHCNLKCKHCYGEFGSGECEKLSKEVVFDLIDQMKALHCKDVSFTGGEVMLHEDFFEILEYATSRNLKVSFLSNGILMDEAFVDRLEKLGPVEIQLSIDGHNSEIHDDFRGVDGSFEKTMKAFKLLRDKDFKVIISHIATSKNYQYLEEMKKLVDEVGGQFKMGSIIKFGKGASTGQEYYIEADKYYEIHKKIPKPEEEEQEEAGDMKPPEYIERCNGGKTRFAVKASGTAVPCDILPDMEELKMGNVRHQRIEDFAFTFDREIGMGDMNALNLKDCKGCEHIVACRGGCLAVAYAETGTFDAMDIFSCARTKANSDEGFEFKEKAL